MAKMLDMIQKMKNGQLPHPPVAQLIGFELTAIKNGVAVIDFVADERHTNPMGTLHGGVLCDIADAAMGLAYASTLDDGESFTTLELKINYLKPVWNSKLQAIGKVIKRGHTIGLTECEVQDENQQLVAKATSTCMTLRGEHARGR